MNEQVLQLGPQDHLVGIWTAPAEPRKRIAVLLLNAGVIHRIGAHRTSVKLARMLAQRGLGCVRFDLSGVGDSRAPRGALDFRAQAARDIATVMDAIQQREGIRDFALVGICSGAAHAQARAVADERVRAAFLIDGFAYPTTRGRWHFARRMMASYGIGGFLARAARLVAQRALHASPPQAVIPVDEGPQRSREEFAQDMEALAARGVDVALMFTGSVLEHYGYERQLQDSFAGHRWTRQVQVLFEPDMDHTVTLRSAQVQLMHRVAAWADRVAARIAR
ncbi:MAG: alpha/beta fold hydrolase [Rubrivivax sp.]|nr:alpha/beta fold hydrolase [Rubrivivax sp.]